MSATKFYSFGLTSVSFRIDQSHLRLHRWQYMQLASPLGRDMIIDQPHFFHLNKLYGFVICGWKGKKMDNIKFINLVFAIAWKCAWTWNQFATALVNTCLLLIWKPFFFGCVLATFWLPWVGCWMGSRRKRRNYKAT